MKPVFAGKISKTVANVIIDEAMVLECSVRGSPFPQVSWFRNGSAILETERTKYYNRNQIVIIREVKLTDGGEYLCRASNAIGTVKKAVTVKVLPSRSNLIEELNILKYNNSVVNHLSNVYTH